MPGLFDGPAGDGYRKGKELTTNLVGAAIDETLERAQPPRIMETLKRTVEPVRRYAYVYRFEGNASTRGIPAPR
jgi:hypothetical protein